MRSLEQYLPGDPRSSGVFSPQDPTGKGKEKIQYHLINLWKWYNLHIWNVKISHQIQINWLDYPIKEMRIHLWNQFLVLSYLGNPTSLFRAYIHFMSRHRLIVKGHFFLKFIF